MKISTVMLIVFSFLIFSTDSFAAWGDEAQLNCSKGTWKCKKPLYGELQDILHEHKRWLDSDGDRGKRADLSGADLSGTDLTDARLDDANLKGADLSGADLSDAKLFGANLRDADLLQARLSRTIFYMTDLKGVVFENIASMPKDVYIDYFANAKNLDKLRFHESLTSLFKLKADLDRAGYNVQAKSVAASIKRSERINDWRSEEPELMASAAFYYVVFELPVQYGARPGRPLWIGLVLIFVFTFPYVIALLRNGSDGIWKVWNDKRARRDLGSSEPEHLRGLGLFSAISVGFYFSVLSAFHIGWKEVNIGSWIAKMQRHEYMLVASGFTRTLAGIQSLISVYLFTLWAVSTFGRPFS